MDLERDAHFFHYTTRDAAFGHIIPDGRLRFSRYMDMRDPLENKSWRFVGGGWGDNADQQFADYFEFDRRANYIRQRSFLLSMTIDVPLDEESDEEEPFCLGWARARMWEQYAENHEGVCLVFDREQLVAAIVSSLREQGFAAPYHRRVIYDGSRIMAPPLDLDALADNVTGEKVAKYIEDNHDPLFFHKALDWQTEREYRFSTTSSTKEHLYVGYEEALVAVLVGERFPIWERPAAIESCSLAGVDSLRLDWSMGQPTLGQLRPLRSRRDVIRENITDAKSARPPAADPPAGT